MNDEIFMENELSQGRKKASSALAVSLLSIACIVFAVLAAATLFVAFSNPRENTFEIFGYKIFCVAEDIQEASIKGGSLIVVRDTDDDEFYTPLSLSENTVLVIENLGNALRQDALWIALCFMIPPALIFALCLVSELKEKLCKREEERLSGAFVISQRDEMEI